MVELNEQRVHLTLNATSEVVDKFMVPLCYNKTGQLGHMMHY